MILTTNMAFIDRHSQVLIGNSLLLNLKNENQGQISKKIDFNKLLTNLVPNPFYKI